VPLETFNYLDSLNVTYPPHSDGVVQGDSHLRGIKLVLKNTFPGVTGPLTKSSGAIVFPDGSQTDPAISFAAEPTLGFYRSSGGAMTFTGRLIGVGTVPIGAIIDFAGSTPPSGYFACDGMALSRTSYPELFAAVQYTWGGAGDTFYIPNFVSRFRRHRDNSVLAGGVGNLQNPANLSHAHQIVGGTGYQSHDHQHYVSGSTAGMNTNQAHSHGFSAVQAPGPSGVGGGGAFGATSARNTDPVNIDCQSALDWDPLSASKGTPLIGVFCW
jgi:microcystin-dependent protein